MVLSCSVSLRLPVLLGGSGFSRRCVFSFCHGLFYHYACLLLFLLLFIVTVIACHSTCLLASLAPACHQLWCAVMPIYFYVVVIVSGAFGHSSCQHVYSISPLLVINFSVLLCRYISMLSSSSLAQSALCCALEHWHMRGKSGCLLLFHKVSEAHGKASELMAHGFAAVNYCLGSLALQTCHKKLGFGL